MEIFHKGGKRRKGPGGRVGSSEGRVLLRRRDAGDGVGFLLTVRFLLGCRFLPFPFPPTLSRSILGWGQVFSLLLSLPPPFLLPPRGFLSRVQPGIHPAKGKGVEWGFCNGGSSGVPGVGLGRDAYRARDQEDGAGSAFPLGVRVFLPWFRRVGFFLGSRFRCGAG
jgi:hypothetical protein